MADDFLGSVFGSDEPPVQEQEAAPAEVVETPTEAVEAPAAEPVQTEPERSPEPPAPSRPEPGYVPIAAMMDERDKRKAAEVELTRYREQQARQTEAPDPFDSPNEYAEYQRAQFAEALQEQKVGISRTLAVRDHGAEAVEAARVWALEKAQNDPGFHQQLNVEMQRQDLPFDWIVQQHKRDALLSDIGDVAKLDDWFAREAAKRGYAIQSAPVAAAAPAVAPSQQAPRPAAPPRSIAGDTGIAQASDTGSDGTFGAIFER